MFIFWIRNKMRLGVGLFLCLMFGCHTKSNRSSETDEGHLEVIVKYSAGDEYRIDGPKDAEARYLPYPFNTAYIRGYESEQTQCIILSQQLNKRRRLEVSPIALFSMKEFGQLKNYIIVIPIDEELHSIPVNDFSDLTTKYVSIKNIIDNWMLDRCGFNCSQNMGWGGESAGLKAIENLMASQL